MFDPDLCRKAILEGNYEWRKHTLQRMAERNVLQSDVIEVVLQGEQLGTYDNDKPFPSALFFKNCESRPLHVVVVPTASSIIHISMSLLALSTQF